jgi:hypothetical protein
MLRLIAASLLLLGMAGPASADLAEEGEALFATGRRASGPAPRATAGGGAVMPATALPCAGCHGMDGGGGRAEAGVKPPPIPWSVLSRPATGRPAYDEPSLLRAVAQGWAAGGRALDAVMPRYELTMEDGRALVAFLRTLDTRGVLGVEEKLVHLGLLVTAGPQGQAFAAAFEAALTAAAPEGVFGRRVSVRRAEIADWRQAGPEAQRLLNGNVLALASALPGEANEAAIAAAAQARVPILSARAGLASGPLAFALLPGVVEEGVAALRLSQAPGRCLILIGGSPAERRLAEAIAGRIGDQAEADPRIVTPGELSVAAADAPGILLLLPPQQMEEVAARLRQGGARLFVPGAMGGAGIRAAAAAAGRPVVAALGVPPATGEGTAERRFASGPAAAGGLPGRLGHAAGEVFVEALRRGGRVITRERLAAALDGPEPFETGSLPQQRLASGARPGTTTILVVEVDADGRVTRAEEAAARNEGERP